MSIEQQALERLYRKAPQIFPVYDTVILPDRAAARAKAKWDAAKPARLCPDAFSSLGLSMLGTDQLRVTADGEIIGSPGTLVISRPRAILTCIAISLPNALALFQAVRNARVCVAQDPREIVRVIKDMHITGNVAIVAEDRGAGCALARQAAQATGAGIVTFDSTEGASAISAVKEWGQTALRRIERTVVAGARIVG